ncbi:hypothetical protein AC249_AIPGENE2755 [Exaiptasia diaphana]|nr:hypothetical protein AC249_AIPGENE2755 [Exaiptasia diaphana]
MATEKLIEFEENLLQKRKSLTAMLSLLCLNHNHPPYLANRSAILGGHENGGFVVSANRLPSFQFGQKYL